MVQHESHVVPQKMQGKWNKEISTMDTKLNHITIKY